MIQLQTSVPKRFFLLAAITLLESTAAHAGTSREFWPELNAYLALDARSRVYLMANSTRPEANEESALARRPTEAVVGAHLDYSLMPMLRTDLREQDWARNRYLWVRVGYQYSRSTNAADAGDTYRENRGVFEMTARTPPMAGQVEWVARTRWDWRNRNGTNSSLYRVRLGAEREFDLQGHVVVPYVTAEAIYDTRHGRWNQRRYQFGSEFAIDNNWRVEPSLELRNDTQGGQSKVLGFGLVLKYYR